MVEIEIVCPYCDSLVYVEWLFNVEAECPVCGNVFSLYDVLVW